jgi:hypothetical protein
MKPYKTKHNLILFKGKTTKENTEIETSAHAQKKKGINARQKTPLLTMPLARENRGKSQGIFY